MDFTRQGNMTVNSMFPTCFNPGNLLLSFQTNFYRIISWKLAIFHSDCIIWGKQCSSIGIIMAMHLHEDQHTKGKEGIEAVEVF